MNPILSGLAQGYSAKQIVQYLQKNFPSLKSPIAKALAASYSADKILNYLSNNYLDEAREQGATPNELQAMRRKGYNKNIGRAAGVAASFLPVGKIAQGIFGGGSQGMPQNPLGSTPPPAPAPMSNAPVHPSSPSQANIAQAAQAVVPPQAPSPPRFDPIGQDPEFKEFAKEQIEKGNTTPLPDLVKQFEKEKNKSPFMKGVKEHLAKMATEDLITPTGDIGTIKSERNGKALVEVDGKLEQFNSKDLQKPDKELFDIVEELLDLPESEKSAVISALSYRPSKRELFVRYHNGKTAVYEDFSPEEMEPIANAMGIPVTSGKNIYGSWEQGKQDSRGAALITSAVRNPKYSKDQEGKTWEYLETPYDRHTKLYKKPKKRRTE